MYNKKYVVILIIVFLQSFIIYSDTLKIFSLNISNENLQYQKLNYDDDESFEKDYPYWDDYGINNDYLGLSYTFFSGDKIGYYNNTVIKLPLLLQKGFSGDFIKTLGYGITGDFYIFEYIDLSHTEGVAYKKEFASSSLITTLGINCSLTALSIPSDHLLIGPDLNLLYLINNNNKTISISFGFIKYLTNLKIIGSPSNNVDFISGYCINFSVGFSK